MSTGVSGLGLLAGAITGKQVDVRESDAINQPCSDLRSILLPAGLNQQQQQHAVIAQALLLSEHSLMPACLRSLLLNRSTVPRFLLAEVARLSRAYHWRVPGSFVDLDVLRQYPATQTTAADNLRWVLATPSLPSAPDTFGTIRVARLLGKQLLSLDESGEPSSGDAPETVDLGDLDDQKQELEDGESSAILKMFANGAGSGGLTQSLLEKLLGAGGSESGDDDGAQGALSVGRVQQMNKKPRFARLMALLGYQANEPATQSFSLSVYPEWDARIGAFRENWAHVNEVDPWRSEPDAIIRERLRPPSHALIRQLYGIGLDYEWSGREEIGDELMVDRVVESEVSRRMGEYFSAQVYRAERRSKRDLAVMIVLDVSGSTAEMGGGSDSIHHQQATLAYQLCQAFEQLGDTVALYGFHSLGRKQVRLLRLKSFTEHSNVHLVERLTQLEPTAFTRLGAALRHAETKLREETRLPHRLLIVISDGFPYDEGYEHTYAEADTRKALDSIRSHGSAAMCVCVGTQRDSVSLRNVFGATATLQASNDDDVLLNIRDVAMNALRVRPG